MNPETFPLIEALLHCVTSDPVNDKERQLKASCRRVLDFIAGIEMLMDEDPIDFPEIEK